MRPGRLYHKSRLGFSFTQYCACIAIIKFVSFRINNLFGVTDMENWDLCIEFKCSKYFEARILINVCIIESEQK